MALSQGLPRIESNCLRPEGGLEQNLPELGENPFLLLTATQFVAAYDMLVLIVNPQNAVGDRHICGRVSSLG